MPNNPPPLPPSTPPAFTPPSPTLPGFIPPPPPPPPMKPEIVVLVLEKIARKTGLFSKVTFRLVVTDRRLIFALQEKTSVDFMRQSPDITLAQNPLNFALPLENVRKIATYQADFESSEPDTMEVITTTEQMKFFISNYYKVQKQLKDVLGAKVS